MAISPPPSRSAFVDSQGRLTFEAVQYLNNIQANLTGTTGLGAAPVILQIPNGFFPNGQALSALTTGYLKNAITTGILTVQAVPIPTTDGGTGHTAGQALTRTNDTNMTLTLGGTPLTALMEAVSLTLGWTGLLGLARGGTNANLSATGGSNQILKQSSSGAAITVGTLASTALSDTALLAYLNVTNTFQIAQQIDATTNLFLQLLRSSATKAYIGVNTSANQLVPGAQDDVFIRTQGGALLISTDAGVTSFFRFTTGGGFGIGATPTQAFSVNEKLQVNTSGVIPKYNNVATAGGGVPAIYGYGRAAAQTSAVASVATYTVGAADGTFVVSANVNITSSTLFSFGVTCTYTDETNTSRILNLSFSQLTGTLVQTVTNALGAGAYEGVPLHIRCKAATAITIATTAGGTYTTVVFNVEGLITQCA